MALKWTLQERCPCCHQVQNRATARPEIDETRSRCVALRRKALAQGPATLSTEELLYLAAHETPPVYPSECVDWADRDIVPLLREMARRFQGWSPGEAGKNGPADPGDGRDAGPP
jgi:hypothetical protein